MASPRTDGAATWILIRCRRCENQYLVPGDAAPAARACPRCRAPQAEAKPGSKIRALLDGRDPPPPQ